MRLTFSGSSHEKSCAVCDDGTAVEDPGCVGSTRTCTGGVPGACRCGYRVQDLQPCAQGSTCVLPPDKADQTICALSTSPDPKCDPVYEDSYCDGSTLVKCLYGYEIKREDCTPAAKCVQAETVGLPERQRKLPAPRRARLGERGAELR